eukprot:95307-Pleurochrysis_carterae.AAC.1
MLYIFGNIVDSRKSWRAGAWSKLHSACTCVSASYDMRKLYRNVTAPRTAVAKERRVHGRQESVSK